MTDTNLIAGFVEGEGRGVGLHLSQQVHFKGIEMGPVWRHEAWQRNREGEGLREGDREGEIFQSNTLP